MKVFKFGGASVKNADAVRNVGEILQLFGGEKLVVVISAMGKTTNALESLHKARFNKLPTNDLFKEMVAYHDVIGSELFEDAELGMAKAHHFFEELNDRLLSPASKDFDLEYDQIVCYGELISTAMVYAYLQSTGVNVSFLDVRQIVKTDNRFRDARVDWSRSAIGAEQIKQQLERSDVVIVQGFIGSTDKGLSTTLGREGSDFTAAILAYLLEAESVTIWKDVPGMLNADPKWMKDTVKLNAISFREAIELAYYGASVIHPKTIKPLQNKGIPLFIKSFIDPQAEGSVIQENGDDDHLIPSYIFKAQQTLISLSTKDFSFVVEDNLKEIFDVLSQLGIRVHLMENSAISFSICMDHDEYKQERLFEALKHKYHIRYNGGLTLMTVRHYDEKVVKQWVGEREVLLEQRNRQTIRMVVR